MVTYIDQYLNVWAIFGRQLGVVDSEQWGSLLGC